MRKEQGSGKDSALQPLWSWSVWGPGARAGKVFWMESAASLEYSTGSFWEGALGTEAEEAAGAGSL